MEKSHEHPLSAARTKAASHAMEILEAALRRVDPVKMITDSLSLQGEELHVATEEQHLTFDLRRFDEILVLGAGKAGAAMARGLERVLEDRISRGLVSVKYGHTGDSEISQPPSRRIKLIEAGHPVPDEESLRAAQEITALAADAKERTLCIALISGGGSALLTLPAQTVTLADIQKTTALLLRAGTPIEEINCVRKHLSDISGGRFCRTVAPATLIALILSDVVGDDLGSIASGLAAPDPTTFADALRICDNYAITGELPERVGATLTAGARGELPETPKPGDPIFERVHPVLIGTNALALEAARTRAKALGYSTLVLTSRITGEAREVARVFAGIAAEIAQRDAPLRKPACLLAGGETTVTLRGDGLGGRNQEMALAMLREIAARPQLYPGVTFLSAGTDGNDGPTDAAGGWATREILLSPGSDAVPAKSAGIVSAALRDNDAYHALDVLGALLKTGPTGTNVCDIQILLVE